MIISVTLGGALSFELAQDGLMERKPRPPREPLVSTYVMFRTAWVTMVMVASIIWVFQWSLERGYAIGEARAVAFTLLVVMCAVYGLNCRSVDEFALGPSLVRPNRPFWISCAVVLALQAGIVHVAFINKFFSCEADEGEDEAACPAMAVGDWGVVFALATALFVLVSAPHSIYSSSLGLHPQYAMLQVEVEKYLWKPVLQPLFERIFGGSQSVGGGGHGKRVWRGTLPRESTACRALLRFASDPADLPPVPGTPGPDFEFIATNASVSGLATHDVTSAVRRRKSSVAQTHQSHGAGASTTNGLPHATRPKGE